MQIDELRTALQKRLAELLGIEEVDLIELAPDLAANGSPYTGDGFLGQDSDGNHVPLFFPWRCTARGAKGLGDLRGDAGGTEVTIRGVTVVPTGAEFDRAVHYVDWLAAYHQLGPFVSGRRVVDPGA